MGLNTHALYTLYSTLVSIMTHWLAYQGCGSNPIFWLGDNPQLPREATDWQRALRQSQSSKSWNVRVLGLRHDHCNLLPWSFFSCGYAPTRSIPANCQKLLAKVRLHLSSMFMLLIVLMLSIGKTKLFWGIAWCELLYFPRTEHRHAESLYVKHQRTRTKLPLLSNHHKRGMT